MEHGPAAGEGRTDRRAIRRVAIAYACLFGAIGAWYPFSPVYFASLGLDLTAIGLLTALSAAVAVVAAPLWGVATDRFRLYRQATPVAALVAALGWAAILLIGSTPALPVAVAALAVGMAGCATLLDTRTIQLLGEDRMGYGRVRMWGSVSFVVVSLLTGALVEGSGAAALFVVAVTLMLVMVALTMRLPGVRTHDRPFVLGQAWLVLGTPVLGVFLLGALIEWGSVEAMNSFYSIRIADLGGSPSTVALAWAISAVAQVPVMFFFWRIAGRVGLGRIIVAGAGVFALRAAVSGFVASADLLVVLNVLEGVGFAIFWCGGVAFVAERAPPHLVATGQGLFSGLVFGLGRVLGSSGGGVVAETSGIPILFGLTAIGCLVAMVVLVAAASLRARAVGVTGAGTAGGVA
jgi:MFS transporter, PPP family, 3-phenylpropionic acid transporter